jgi:pimeloyl-ACP methyl ester carboxylesterase
MYPAGLPGIVARSVTLPNGIALRVVESGSQQGYPIVLVHGWGACVYTFRYTIDALAASGRRVLAFDLRGHGLSAKPVAPNEYTTEALLADLTGLFDVYRLDVADLVGHSLGGGLALRFALKHAGRVRRLGVAAPVGLTSIPLRNIACLLTPRLTDNLARFLTPRWMTSFLVRGAYGDPGRVSEEIVDQYWAPSQFPNYYRATRALLHRFDWQPLSATELGRLRVPTLVILGGSDRLIRGTRGAEQRARRIRNASIVNMDRAGHLGLEEHPEQFNAALLRFLDTDEFL